MPHRSYPLPLPRQITRKKGKAVPTSAPNTEPSTTSQAALTYAEPGRPVPPGAVWHDGHFADPVDERPVSGLCLRPVEAATTDSGTEPAERSAPTIAGLPWSAEQFTGLMRELAAGEAPRLFALVEEYGEAEDARVAGYGLAYADRADVNSVEGGFQLHSRSAESARTLFEISSRSAGVRHVHVVWLDRTAQRECAKHSGRERY